VDIASQSAQARFWVWLLTCWFYKPQVKKIFFSETGLTGELEVREREFNPPINLMDIHPS
jgi:hypothetical protein